MRVRKCGCIGYDYGPPMLCEEHEAKAALQEERALRKLVRERAEENGHDIGPFTEYNPDLAPGKWTAWCGKCGALVIVYDEPPDGPDQISGRPLTARCRPAAMAEPERRNGLWRED